MSVCLYFSVVSAEMMNSVLHEFEISALVMENYDTEYFGLSTLGSTYCFKGYRFLYVIVTLKLKLGE